MLLYTSRMFPRRFTASVRVLALLLVSFQVLAAGRALVPNLCLTQREAAEEEQARGNESIACKQHSCCATEAATKGDTGKPGMPAGRESGRCAFCFLAKAYVEAPEFFSPVLLPQVADAPYAQGAGRIHQHIAGGLVPGRAPPAAA